jgi:hypothetical protein
MKKKFKTLQNMFVILVKIYVLHSKSNIELNHALICKSCERKIKHGKPFDSNLKNHIIENKPNMNFILMLNNITEHLIAPCFAFAPTFQLQ